MALIGEGREPSPQSQIFVKIDIIDSKMIKIVAIISDIFRL